MQTKLIEKVTRQLRYVGYMCHYHMEKIRLEKIQEGNSELKNVLVYSHVGLNCPTSEQKKLYEIIFITE